MLTCIVPTSPRRAVSLVPRPTVYRLQYKHYGRVSDKRLRQGGSGYESNARLQSRLLDMKHPTAFRLDLIKLFHLFMHEDSLNESDAGLKRSYELTILHQF